MVINLNRYRKQRQRAEAKIRGAENRLRSGRPKVDRQRDADERERRAKDLDGKRLD